MATDYDAPRKQEDELKEDSIEELQTRRTDAQSGTVDEDEAAAAESFELPGADLSNEELSVVVLPAQEDEFTCGSCFLVRHRSQIAEERGGVKYCVECVGCAPRGRARPENRKNPVATVVAAGFFRAVAAGALTGARTAPRRSAPGAGWRSASTAWGPRGR